MFPGKHTNHQRRTKQFCRLAAFVPSHKLLELLESLGGFSVKKFLAAAIAAAAFCSVPAIAAPPAAPMFNWTGFYVGAHAGYGWGDMKTTFQDSSPGSVVPPAVFPNGSGALGGLQIGYNVSSGYFVLGLETDISLSGIKGRDYAMGPGVPLLTTSEQKIPWFGTVRGRLGVLPTDRLLIFATGGLAYGETKFSENMVPVGAGLNCGNTTCFVGSASGTGTGGTVGGGFEYAFAPNMTVKGEYLFVDLGSRTGNYLFTQAAPGRNVTVKADFQTNIVRAGLNFKY